MRPSRAASLVAAAALAACGDTLVDHRADLRQGRGNAVCDVETQVSCHVDGADVCKEESARFCGQDCVDCNVGFVPPHASAIPACLGNPGVGVCDYECTGGLLKCPTGCCAATQLSAGAAHTCAITDAAGLFCWGLDDEGQVTGAPSAVVRTPRQRWESGVTAVAAGAAHTCAVHDGQVFCWGLGFDGLASVGTAAGDVELAAGDAHTCARIGTVVQCWPNGGAPEPVPGAAGATRLAAGAAHTCALVAGGGVACWGENAAGQLGDGTTTASAAPVPAIASGMRAIAAAGNHTCAGTVSNGGGIDDALRCWGDQPGPLFGLASAQTTPKIPMKDAGQSVVRDDVIRLATGGSHVCVQKSSGESVQCFGPEIALGQLGGAPAPATLTELVDVSVTLAGATAFAAGDDHTCAILPGGGVFCWGSNALAQLGDGTVVTPGVDDQRPLGTQVPVSGR